MNSGTKEYWGIGFLYEIFHHSTIPTFKTEGTHPKSGTLKMETTGGGNVPPPVY